MQPALRRRRTIHSCGKHVHRDILPCACFANVRIALQRRFLLLSLWAGTRNDPCMHERRYCSASASDRIGRCSLSTFIFLHASCHTQINSFTVPSVRPFSYQVSQLGNSVRWRESKLSSCQSDHVPHIARNAHSPVFFAMDVRNPCRSRVHSMLALVSSC